MSCREFAAAEASDNQPLTPDDELIRFEGSFNDEMSMALKEQRHKLGVKAVRYIYLDFGFGVVRVGI